MGFTEMAAASAPSEDARKCWLKATYQGRSRMIEWNASWVNFKDLDTKVKKMFGVSEKHRLIFSYLGVGSTEIVMSSDEELSSALHFMNGEVLLVNLTLERKKKKNILARTLRAATAQRPVILEFIRNVPANVCSCLPHGLSAANIYACADRMRNAAQGFAANVRFACPQRRGADAANADAGPSQQPRRPCRLGSAYRKVTWFMFFLVLALFFAHARNISHMKNEWRESLYRRGFHTLQSDPHVTILNANYGGRDVTNIVQDYYNRYGHIQASNTVFGDPSYGNRKFLHVVYQHISPKSGLAEVYSQSFYESQSAAQFSMSRENCAFPEEAIVDGRSVKVLGALYEDVVATCAARRFAATGHLSSTGRSARANFISRTHFGTSSNNPYGAFTLVYLKDNKLRTFVGREGNNIIL